MTAQHARGITTAFVLGCIGLACARPFARDDGRNQADLNVIDDVVADDVMTAGRRVRVQGEVEGDVAAAGSEVTVAGPVAGYVMGAGRTVTLGGSVGNDLWLAGERVRVDGQVEHNAMLAGRNVELNRSASIGHDVKVAANHVRSEARVDHDLIIGAASAEIGGEVGGLVKASAGRVTVLPDAIVHGDLVVRSPEPPIVSPDARVAGTVRYEDTGGGSRWSAWPWFAAGAFLSLLILGLATLSIFPAWTARVSDTMKTRVPASVLTGALLVVGTPIVVGLLAVTVVGIPLAAVLLAFYLSLVLLSSVLVSYRIGHWLLERRRRHGISPWAAMAIGTLSVAIAVTFPMIGWIAALIVILTGVGAIALQWRNANYPLRTATY